MNNRLKAGRDYPETDCRDQSVGHGFVYRPFKPEGEPVEVSEATAPVRLRQQAVGQIRQNLDKLTKLHEKLRGLLDDLKKVNWAMTKREKEILLKAVKF